MLSIRYPQYKFYFNNSYTVTNSRYNLRSNNQGFRSFLFDVIFLSNADHIVCTFTSNVCRVGYELLLSNSSDSWKLVRSLDIHYLNFEFYKLKRIAVLNHNSRGFEFKKGQLLYKDVYYTHSYDSYNHDGTYTLKLFETHQVGTSPSYKTKDFY